MEKTLLLTVLLLPLFGALISYILGMKARRYRDPFNMIMTGGVFAIVTYMYTIVKHGTVEVFIPDIMVTGLYLKLDMFRYIFVWLTCFIWFLTTIYSTQYLIKYKNRNRYYAFFMLTLGSTIGVFLSENILNLFTFFEIMSLTSYALIIHDEDQYAHEAGKIYIGMAIGGGLILLLGIFLLFEYTGTLNISQYASKMDAMGNLKYLIAAFILIGFGIKASMVPLHVWLPKVYPAAPTPASAILSGILVKTGIFGIMILVGYIMKGDPWISMIVFTGGLMNMLLGGFLAMFQRNIKRILAYSSMSQAGYMLVGIGLMGILKDHKALAIYGALYHVVNHGLFKVLLFMGAGIIYMILHELSINEIRGFGRNKPMLMAVFLVGILAVAGVPGFNGFVSKTLLHEALAEAHYMFNNTVFTIIELLFTVSSGFTVAYMLKLFLAVFVEKNDKFSGQYKKHVRKRAILPAAVIGATIIIIGIKPDVFLPIMDEAAQVFQEGGHTEVHIYTLGSIKSSMTSIALGFVIYFGFVRKFLRKSNGRESWYVNPALNWFNLEKHAYKPLLMYLFHLASDVFHFIDRSMINLVKMANDGIIALKQMEIPTNRWKRLRDSIAAGMLHKPSPLEPELHFQKAAIEPMLRVKTYGKQAAEDMEYEVHRLSDLLQKARVNMNTLMASIFVFAVMLAVVLLVMVL
ncbi:MAG: complex I subunit 5 family protein [Bacillota bacterium]